MRIREIFINNFAGLHGVKLSFGDGVNIIKGGNESGKSRICGFIRFMLYGLQKKEDLNRILSFGESSCSGSMTVSTDGGLFRIEREAAFAERGGRLACTKSRCLVTDVERSAPVETEKTPGELFLGVPAQVYSSTAYINQIDGNRTGDSELSEQAANIIFSADENMSAEKAISDLDAIRTALYHKDRRGGRIAEETAKIEELKAQLISMERQNAEMISLTGTCAELREKKAASDKRLAGLKEFFAEYERWQIKKTCEEFEKTLRERDGLRAEAERIRLEISKDGFFPDAGYLSSLRNSGAAAEHAMLSAIEAAEAEKSAAAAREKLNDKAAFLEKLNEKGGCAKVRERHDRLKKKRKLFAVLTLVLAVCAFVCAVLAALGFISVIPFYKQADFALAGSAGLFALAAAASAFSAKSKAKGIAALANGFGMNDRDFSTLLSALEGNEAAVASIIERERSAAAARIRAEAVYSAALSDTKELLSRAFDVSNVPDGELLAFAADSVAETEKRHGEISSLTSRADAKDEQAESIGNRLRRCSDEEISAARAETFDEERLSSVNIQEKKRELDFLTNSQSGFTERLHECETRLSVLTATTTPAADIESEIERIAEQLERDKLDFDAVMTAMDCIRRSEEELKSSISPRIAKKAGEIMKLLSAEKYDSLSVSGDFGLSYLDGGMTRDIAYLSAGTSDIAYLALRIALVDTLFSGEKPPLVFDESFTRLDPDRLGKLSVLTGKLAAEGVQCMLFCCDDRLDGFDGRKTEL